jgi:hypothetical protein
MKEPHPERVSLIGMHPLIAVSGIRVVFPLNLDSPVGIASHFARWGE